MKQIKQIGKIGSTVEYIAVDKCEPQIGIIVAIKASGIHIQNINEKIDICPIVNIIRVVQK